MRVLFRWASRSAGIHVVSPLRTVACTTRHTLGVSFWDLTGCLLEHAPMYPQGGNLTQSSLSIVGLTDSNFRNLSHRVIGEKAENYRVGAEQGKMIRGVELPGWAGE